MEKINVAKLLKDCPQGMELDCTCADNVVFDKIIEYEQIKCVIGECRDPLILDKYGRLLHICCPKCVIFPKGKTTWEGFVPPCKFKDGDILAYSINSTKSTIFIYRYDNPRWNTSYFVALSGYARGLFTDATGALSSYNSNVRFATEEEKQKLFDAIKANGYRWNAEKKELERLVVPKFKVGDRIKWIKTGNIHEIIKILSNCYIANYLGSDITILFDRQDEYELVPHKFDINTLKPFDNCKYSLDKGKTWKFAQYWYIQDNYNVTDIEIELWQD